jgi:TolB-like protein
MAIQDSQSKQDRPSDRLDSWKEIAAYLRRSERTVRRWEEKEGLPVQRLAHEKRGSVYASKAALDTWWASRKISLESEDKPFNGQQVSNQRPIARLLWLAIAGLAVLTLAIAVAVRFWPQKAPLPTAIAVLPLVNLSTDPDTEYFADGLTGEIIHQLANTGGLRVSSQTSSFALKKQGLDIHRIGEQLKVGAVVEGSVRKQGNRVEIIAQLIQVSDDRQLWSGKFERDVKDASAVQSEIASEIVHRLQPRLQSNSSSQPSHRQPAPQAYESYLRGRYFLNQWNADGARKSVDYFEQATVQDPGFADAHGALALAYQKAGWYWGVPPADLYPRAKSAAEKALSTDAASAEAHLGAAFVKWFFEWDWQAAEREYQRALQVNPSLADAWATYGQMLALEGRDAESTDKLAHALELDPVSLPLIYMAGESHYYGRRYDEALRLCRQIEEMNPRFRRVKHLVSMILLEKKMYQEAIRAINENVESPGRRVPQPALLGYAYAISGHKSEAMQVLAAWNAASRERHLPPGGMARMYLGLGDKQRALEWFDRCLTERDSDTLVSLKASPIYDRIRTEPRFVAILEKIGLNR